MPFGTLRIAKPLSEIVHRKLFMVKVKDSLPINLWLEYWTLYDSNCWRDFLSRPVFRDKFEEGESKLLEHIHNHIMVPAIEEIERNMMMLDDQSKFLYWFRFQRELAIVSEPFNNVDFKNLKAEADLRYQEYLQTPNHSNQKPALKKSLDFDYFKEFYSAICSVLGDAEIFLNEILFNLPLLQRSQINQRNLELLEKRRSNTINIVNYGNIDSVIKNLDQRDYESGNTSHRLTNQEVVESIIKNFKRQIEDNGLFKLLYEGREKKLRHESTAQQLFFSVAQIYCLANDLDVSPETNSGMGSVDFKFSHGAKDKINVEIKYSTNKAIFHGYESQLLTYDRAENANRSYYLVLQVDDSTSGIEKIRNIESKENPNDCKLRVVDARLRSSASKK